MGVEDALWAAISAEAREILTGQPFGPAFASAARHAGRQPISSAAAAAITFAGLLWPVTGADECARAALILRDKPPVRDLFRRGEVRERQAVLRVLAALPDPASHVELAIDACRTNVLTVFESIACDNAFVAHLPEPAFCQLVLKALFVGAPVGRIHGLSGRRTPELRRMVAAYASERRAAGRAIPSDVEVVLQ